ncbi:MAG TPA: AI-2E family transporter, partial [Thermoanaerobaculia bacterium]
LVLQLLWLVHPRILATFLGLLFGLAVARGADSLERFRIPRGIAAAVLVLSAYALLVGAGALAGPAIARQFGELRTKLPQALDRVDHWFTEHQDGVMGRILVAAGSGEAAPAATAPAAPAPAPARKGRVAVKTPPAAAAKPPEPSRLSVALTRQVSAAAAYLFPFLSSTVEVIGGLLLITFIAIYFASDPALYRRGVLHLVPIAGRPRANEVLAAIGATLRRWLLTQLVAMLVIGAAVTITLELMGVEAALSLGIIAGVLEFIPTIGPIVSALPAIGMGFLVSPEKALAVLIAFIVIQQLEGHILIPILMKSGMDLPPVLTILAQALMGLVFGFLGLLTAVPLLAVVIVAVKLLYVEDVVGEKIASGAA